MLHQSVKTIIFAIRGLLESANIPETERAETDDGIPHNRIYSRTPQGVILKSNTVVRVSPDLAKRIAGAIEIWMPLASEPIENPRTALRIENGDMHPAYVNKVRRLYRVLSGAESHRWYALNTFGATFARDQGLPPNTIQIDVVRDGVIFRNEPYTQYAFDELIRSIEHAEAQQ